jgi:2-polyprenyl-6-methoxyphenol hydroxylase-like FAD-dependent oxidoreductase
MRRLVMSAPGNAASLGTAGQAVVIGAGFAGLLAARVLAGHGHDVVVLDRDRIPVRPARRPGVPQDAHVHALFDRGLRALEGLLPGFGEELCRRGGHRIDVGRDLAVVSRHGRGVRFTSGLHVIGASRPLMEAVIRDRVRELPNVRLLERHQADALAGTRGHVERVDVRDLTAHGVFTLAPDLVVDASGRGSRLPGWLAQLGCARVRETVVDAHVGYATRLFSLPDSAVPSDWRACYAPAGGPALTRGGVLAPIENDRWIATLIGVGADRPGRAAEDFLPFARTLATSAIADALSKGEPLSPVMCSRSTRNRRRHLARAASRLPGNLLVIGDSALSLDPVYAQGMTVAALSAALLDRHLSDRSHRPPAPRYHRALGALHAVPWMLATASDLRYPGTDGPGPRAHQRLLGWYADRVLAAGIQDSRAQKAFLEVLNMTGHPARLLAPSVLAAALLRGGTSTDSRERS